MRFLLPTGSARSPAPLPTPPPDRSRPSRSGLTSTLSRCATSSHQHQDGPSRPFDGSGDPNGRTKGPIGDLMLPLWAPGCASEEP
jgi:hypothetical protein